MPSLHFSSRRPTARRHAGSALPVIVVALAIVGLVGWRLAGRAEAETALRERTTALALPVVSVIAPKAATGADEFTLPGNVRAWDEAPIHARTSGYLKRWLVDIGTPVKAGELLAEIDAPEVDQQLRQAEADLATAEANAKIAAGTAERYRTLLASRSVAPQEAEDRFGEATARAAAANSARANVQRLREIAGFKRVLAPFAGTVTARNAETGALISAGAGEPLFRIASTRKLRVYVQVPESLAGGIKVGQTADVLVAGAAHTGWPARIASTATAIAPGSRTLLTQLDLDNASGAVLPGAFAEVRFKLPARPDVLRLPTNALLFRADGLNVAVVDAQERIALRQVVAGRDFGKEIEIVAGLAPTDRVVLNPSDSAANGVAVRVAVPADAPADAAKGAAK
ncbi:efflux RND transporter periplasmic adaptor subunit [Derxia lacustris]|uniref:efflux RND transporter periplasmic adaptor subunit n=1 Tax=Derxia lacustris TaxID=764842 RepID=UPI000A174D66|nr:efflux RND transporter periplasmic adaptor subunit [Derxia lacustris]